MEAKKLTRRALLERGGALGLVVLGAGAGLTGCGGGEPDCANPMGLSPQERTQRQALAYVDRAPNPSQRCEVCSFFTAPAQPNTCGGCTLNIGPVSAAGYCSSFVVRS